MKYCFQQVQTTEMLLPKMHYLKHSALSRGRGIAVSPTSQIAFHTVKAHWKNVARGFMYFWQQQLALVYGAIQLWNIQCSLLCVWSFSFYKSSDSTVTVQFAVCYSSLSGRLFWQLPEMSWKSIPLVTVSAQFSGRPSLSQQKDQR